MNCEPNALAAAAKCFCLTKGMARQVQAYLLNQWAVSMVPDYPYNDLVVARVGNNQPRTFLFFAMSFMSPGFRSSLQGLRALLSKQNANAGTLTATLWASDAPTLPTLPIPTVPIIAIGTINDATLPLTPTYTQFDFTLSANPQLAANTRYWIQLSDTGTARIGLTTLSTDPAIQGEYTHIHVGALDQTFKNSATGSSMFRVQVERLC